METGLRRDRDENVFPFGVGRRLHACFTAAFGHDGVGQIGSETTINSADLAGILMIAVQALEKRTAELKQKEAQIAELKAKQAYFETVAARVEALELRNNHPIQITAEKSVSGQ